MNEQVFDNLHGTNFSREQRISALALRKWARLPTEQRQALIGAAERSQAYDYFEAVEVQRANRESHDWDLFWGTFDDLWGYCDEYLEE
jgi:hypothetical protein